MRKQLITLLCAVCAFAANAQNETRYLRVNQLDGTVTKFEVSSIDSIDFVTEEKLPDFNGHEYVDLGLPSGTLWATCNVGLGATEPQHNGAYYAWGETDSYSSYASYSYEWYEFVSEKITKYCTDSDDGYLGFTDNKTVLDLEDDAAHVNWGGTWRMPTKKEFEELFDEDNCTWGWYEKLKGVIITSKKNGNSIFLPGAGFRDSKLHYKDDYCYYWTSSLDESSPRFAYSLVIYKDAFYAAGMTLGSDQRWRGFSVRAVCKK